MVQIHSPRPTAKKSADDILVVCQEIGGSNVLAQRSHFPLQIGVKWRDAATTFSSFCSPRSPNRTSFGMGRLKPRPTFSPHSSRYWTSSRRASVARAHVVVLIGHPVSRNANVLNQKRFLIAPSFRFVTEWSVFFQPIDAPRFGLLPDVSSDDNCGLDPPQSPVNTSRLY